MARNPFSTNTADALMSGFSAAENITDTIRQKRASYRAAPKLATGDYRGASREYGAMGLDEAAAATDQQARGLDEQQKAEVAKRGELLIKAASALTKVPPGQRKQALGHPFFQAVGLTPDMIAPLSEDDLSDQSLAMFVGQVQREVEFIKAGDGSYTAADKATGQPLYQYQAPTPDKYEQVDPEKDLVRIPGREGGVSGFDAVIDPLMQREGGFVAKDGRSNAPANFGINQRFNPDVDVSKLTPEQAKSIYRERYWNAIDGDNLPPEAQAAVFDAAVNQGPERARQWWQQSGGDLAKFNEFRLQHYRSRPDYEKYGKGWERRVAETGGVEVVHKGQPKPKPMARPATIEEKRAYGIPDNAPAQIRPDGTIDVVGGERAANNNPRKAEADLRKEFNARPEVKEYRDVSNSYRTIRELFSKSGSAAGDIAGIFAFMKMLDPGSVVREGEFANAQNAAGVPDIVRNAYNRALSGQRLNPKQRADFLSQAESIYTTRSRRYADIVSEYRGYASDYELNPDRIATMPGGDTGGQSQAGQFSAAQRATAQRLAQRPEFKRLSVGTRGRPFAPRSEAEFRSIKSGQWYIDDDGQVYQKGR